MLCCKDEPETHSLRNQITRCLYQQGTGRHSELYYDRRGVWAHAVVHGKCLRLNLSLDHIEDLQGNIGAEANHTRDAKLRNRLDKIFAKLQGFLDKYDDHYRRTTKGR